MSSTHCFLRTENRSIRHGVVRLGICNYPYFSTLALHFYCSYWKFYNVNAFSLDPMYLTFSSPFHFKAGNKLSTCTVDPTLYVAFVICAIETTVKY